MLIKETVKNANSWKLVTRTGEELVFNIEKHPQEIEIGLLGTRTINKKMTEKTNKFAKLLNKINKPIYLIDSRRDGVGGSGSWSPKEFETIIADKIVNPYNYIHIPSICPSVSLLDNWKEATKKFTEDLTTDEIEKQLESLKNGNLPEKASYKHWQIFKEVYKKEMLSEKTAIEAARAIVEYVASINGLAIFLCAEEHHHDFDALTQKEKDDAYCHRFTLFSLVKKSIQKDYPNTKVTSINLSLDDL